MFLAAFTSALQAYPQAVQANTAWLSRLLADTCPHAEQRWLVYAGGTFSTRPGALSSRRRATGYPRGVRQLPAPLREAGHLPSSGTPAGFLLDAQVPHVPGVSAVPQQRVGLRGGWLKTVPAHGNILSESGLKMREG